MIRQVLSICCLLACYLGDIHCQVSYHSHDTEKVYRFLTMENLAGIPNWYRLNMIEMAGMEDIDRWIALVPGIEWTDATGDRRLKKVDWSNYFTSGHLDLSGCTALEELYCQHNSLLSVDVGGCISLRILHCQHNAYKSAVLNNMEELYDLSSLEQLNVGGCIALEELRCNDNYLSELNVAGLNRLRLLDCSTNRLLFAKLPATRSLPAETNYRYAPQRHAHPEEAARGSTIDLSPLLLPGAETTIYINQRSYRLNKNGQFTLPALSFTELYIGAENSLFPAFTENNRLTYTIHITN